MAKRGAQGSGSIRKRSDGRWEARFTAGRDPGTGRQVQKSIYGTTQAEVRKKLQAVTAAIDEGAYTSPSPLSVGAWLDIWVAEYLPDVKPRTAQSYRATVEGHLKPELGAVKLSALTAPQIQAVYNRLHNGGLSPKTIKNLHGVLHKALEQAIEIGYIRFNPARACKLPRVEKAEIHPLDEREIAAFMEAVKGHPFEAVYLTTLFTGMRESEVLGLTWNNVDFEAGTLTISRQLQRIDGEYRFTTPKNGKSRRITPAPFVLDVLRNQRKRQAEWQLKAGTAWQNENNLVFTNETGRNLSAQTVYLQFKKAVAAIGRPDARFHDLRHTYAVAALESGDDVKTVQENLGHHTAAFTLDVYGHVTEKMKAESAARMERFIKGVSGL